VSGIMYCVIPAFNLHYLRGGVMGTVASTSYKLLHYVALLSSGAVSI